MTYQVSIRAETEEGEVPVSPPPQSASVGRTAQAGRASARRCPARPCRARGAARGA